LIAHLNNLLRFNDHLCYHTTYGGLLTFQTFSKLFRPPLLSNHYQSDLLALKKVENIAIITARQALNIFVK